MIEAFFNNPIYVVIASLFAFLSLSSLIVAMMRRADSNNHYKELSDRIKSWWLMIAIFSTAILTSPLISILFFALLSFLAFKEYVSIIPLRRVDRRLLFWAYATIPLQYYLVHDNWYGMFIVFIPVWVFLLLPFRLILTDNMEGFLSSIATVSWGLMITVFAISHTAMLMHLSFSSMGEVIQGANLILFLVILNQGNDVAQYIWGKLLGKHKILPHVSPKKTWEGFIGGIITTIAVGLALSSILTPFFSLPFAILISSLIAITGFMGDVMFSALKRDMGIKDTGALIPGHGGILDRIDSLSLASPLFFHAVHYVYF